MPSLGPEANRIFRITHVDNVPWILENGLHCRSSKVIGPKFVSIGSVELIEKRAGHPVPISRFGTLADYVPFYFTSHSMMHFTIVTGRGIKARSAEELAILVSSLDRAMQCGLDFVFTNGHAYMRETGFFKGKGDLNRIDWDILRRRDFRRDDDDPGKSDRYQAEALIHKHVPVEAILGIGCYSERTAVRLRGKVKELSVPIRIDATPQLFFRP